MQNQTIEWKRFYCKSYTVKEANEVASYGEWQWNQSVYYYVTNIYDVIKEFADIDLRDTELSVYYIEDEGRIFLPDVGCDFSELKTMPREKFILMRSADMLYELTDEIKSAFVNIVTSKPDHDEEIPIWFLKLVEEGIANIDNWKYQNTKGVKAYGNRTFTMATQGLLRL